MRLFDERGPEYVRLDDDVSFQIVRTNPKLTTNTKLVYDGENLYMDAYPAVPILSTMEYKNHRVWKTGLFNRDIRNFLLGTNTAAYAIGQNAQNTVVLNAFDNQFENMYWCGVESINSDIYPQEMGCIAPLYLRKKRPNYFVIFKIDTPANTIKETDVHFEFDKDVQNRAKIIKTFDLREGTPIGDYIKRYVEQRDFQYDKSIYVNFSSDKIYYYGIDKNSGVLTQKVEDFKEKLLDNDNTILKMDDWITSGFERNNLIFPYIINFEFLFDDNDIEEYKFARYFGMYCNDIDLYELSVLGGDYLKEHNKTHVRTLWDDETTIEIYNMVNTIGAYQHPFFYLKDKNKNFCSIDGTYVPGLFEVSGKIDIDKYMGFNTTSVSTYAEPLGGVGYSTMMFKIVKSFDVGDNLTIYSKIGGKETVLGTFTASNIPQGKYDFSRRGSVNDIAQSLASVINNCKDGAFKWLNTFSIDNVLVIRSAYPGTEFDNYFRFVFNGKNIDTKFEQLTKTFGGGTNHSDCIFKVYTSDAGVFSNIKEGDFTRYLKTGPGRSNAAVISFMPYINEDNKIDEEYSIITTDSNGRYVNISATHQIEIVDKFYATLGVLSFFPIKDFDFDTISSAYGEYTNMKNELQIMDAKLYFDDNSDSDYDSDSDSDSDSDYDYEIPQSIKYSRFYSPENDEIGTEYEYYFENVLPELTTISKTVPFINKWGYMDDAKDSCENPYRLNTSKIFEASNFSANTFMQNGDIMEYTHSMPYYVNNRQSVGDNTVDKNEYQYICLPQNLVKSNYNDYVKTLTDYFSQPRGNDTRGLHDPFDAIFGDTSKTQYSSKRFNKKYSRFLTGDKVINSSTLFRGVKFEIKEIKDGKEISTGKYNGYKFSFIYVPVADIPNDNHTVHFIKNDDYKFIVGIVFFNVHNDLDEIEFNKAYVYAGCMGLLNPSKNK